VGASPPDAQPGCDSCLSSSRVSENQIRQELLEFLNECQEDEHTSVYSETISRWLKEVQPLPIPDIGRIFRVKKIAADPAWANEKKALGKASGYRFPGDPYGYKRAFENTVSNIVMPDKAVILDPTAGGGSIPFEALRLGHKVIANELNPVASVILHATLDYPARWGRRFKEDIEHWGKILLEDANEKLSPFFSDDQELPASEQKILEVHLTKCPEYFNEFNSEAIMDYLYCRQVTCPHCNGEAPLLNTCWLSKESGKQWGVKIVTTGKSRNGKVRFETYRISKGKGPRGEDPNFATVSRGVGLCIHCRQAIDADEIKSQARGESLTDKWKDRLYCVVGIRFQPKLDIHGKSQRYKSGKKKGQIKTEKIRFFRSPNKSDLTALDKAEKRLNENWDRWDSEGLIPTESIPLAHKTKEPLRVGMNRWCDMFTPRQLLGHVTLIEELNQLKPQIIAELGEDKGRAIVTYLQFAIDKGLDYNSRQTLWHASRGVIAHTFTRHDYSLKWTFGELILIGPNSGAAWALNQILDSYSSISKLIWKSCETLDSRLVFTNTTAAHMPNIENASVDLVCMDPPYYNNVQYAELSDYFYVWQKRTLHDLYPDYFTRRLTNKQEEAVANPDRDGGNAQAKAAYERMMGDIFSECHRVLKNSGLMTLMFTHKSQDAWETLTRSLIENEWVISASFPVESETQQGIHTKETASAISSIFISCRKRLSESTEPATWTGFGGTGVQQRIRKAVKAALEEFKPLNLNPVDEMVASYGRALRVLSEQWPVFDGDEPVSPVLAMNEASRVVSENQIQRITDGRLKVDDLSPEAAMSLTIYGIYGLNPLPYDEALNLSRSLNIQLVEVKTGGYLTDNRFIGISPQAASGRRSNEAKAEETGFYAPLIRKGSKLRLARPDERNPKRLENPQTEWDILHGLIMEFRKGDIPLVRAYLTRHAEGKENLFKDLLNVWTTESADETLRKEGQAMIFGLNI